MHSSTWLQHQILSPNMIDWSHIKGSIHWSFSSMVFLEIEVIVQTVVFCHKAWLASCQGTHQRVTVHHIWSPFQFRFFLKLRRFWVKYEIFCFCKSSSNPFLEPTSTKQWEQSFLLKETTWTFDGAQTHDWRISSQIRYPLRQVPSLFGRLVCIL